MCGGYLTAVVIAGIVHHPHCEFFTCCTFTKGFVCGGYLTVVTIAGIVHHPIVNSLIVAHLQKGLCVADIQQWL